MWIDLHVSKAEWFIYPPLLKFGLRLHIWHAYSTNDDALSNDTNSAVEIL